MYSKALACSLVALTVGNTFAQVRPASLDEAWEGLVLQIDVQHPGGEWVPREVRGLRHASDEAGNVKAGFVEVELLGVERRIIKLRCEGDVVAQQYADKTGMKPILSRCNDVRYRIAVVPQASAQHPHVGEALPAHREIGEQ